MPAYTTITLDTTAPQDPAVVINSGDPTTTDDDVTLAISTSDADTTGYTMKIYGDVDDAAAPSSYRAAEGDAPWVAFNGTASVRLAAGDGPKTVRIKIRDDVWNVSAEATDAITLDTTIPVVTIQPGSPDVAKISKVSGKDTATIVWQSDTEYEEYKVKVVPSDGSPHTAGTTIPTTAGSTNTSGSAGGYPADTNVTTTVKGTDLEAASGGDGAKVVKVFAREASGNWSA